MKLAAPIPARLIPNGQPLEIPETVSMGEDLRRAFRVGRVFASSPTLAGPAARAQGTAAARVWGSSAPRERRLGAGAHLLAAEAAWAWQEESQAWGWDLVDQPRMPDGWLQDVGFGCASWSS